MMIAIDGEEKERPYSARYLLTTTFLLNLWRLKLLKIETGVSGGYDLEHTRFLREMYATQKIQEMLER